MPASRPLIQNLDAGGWRLAGSTVTFSAPSDTDQGAFFASVDNLWINGVQIFGGIDYTWPGADAAGVLTSDGAGNLSWSAAGTGDVAGPGPTVDDNAVVLFDGTGGLTIKQLANGTDGQVLTMVAGAPAWAAAGGGGGLDDAFANLIVSDTGGTYSATGADTLTLTGGTDISVTRSGANVTIAFTGSIPTVPGTKNSIEVDSGDLQLVGDQASPGNTKLYGTDGSGNKGWYDQPSGGGGGGGGETRFRIWARDITPRFSNGCGDLQLLELTAGNPDLQCLPFAPSVDTFAQFTIYRMPTEWNGGTITVEFIWAHPATTTNFGVTWQARARVLRDDDAIDAAFGTAVNVTDTGGTTNDYYHSSATAAITPIGTAGTGASLVIQVGRIGTDGSDTMAVEARLLAVIVNWTAT